MKICSSASSQLVIFTLSENPPLNTAPHPPNDPHPRKIEDIFKGDIPEKTLLKGTIQYKSFLPKEIDHNQERLNYRQDFIKDLFSQNAENKVDISIRTISQSVTESEWYSVYQKILNDAQRITDIAKYREQIELLKTQEDKPINFGESEHERQNEYSAIAEKLKNGEKFLLCGFSPFNFKIIKGIILELIKIIKTEHHLTIYRYNLSDMLGSHTDTYLYARKEQLEIKGNLIQFKEFMDAIRWVVDNEIMDQYETVKKLAYFYYGTEDEKKNHFYDSDVTKKLLDQYKKAFDEVHLDYKNNFYSKEFTEFLLDKYLQTS
jgi:hypothetical protein